MTNPDENNSVSRPEPISDGDQVFDRESATVDRMARNADDFHGHRFHHHHDDHDQQSEHHEGWGFRIRHFLDSLKG
jgi:hypothetical protein